MEPSEEFEVEDMIQCPQLFYNVPGTTYTCVRIPSDPTSGKWSHWNKINADRSNSHDWSA